LTKSLIKKSNETNETLFFWQKIVRHWSSHLSAHEFVVLMNLVDRTIGWQKTQATFSLNRVLEGDRLYDGIQHMVSRRSLFYALASLEKKGMIARHKHPEGKQIRLYSVNTGWTPPCSDFPTTPKAGATVAPDQCKPCTAPVQEMHTREGNQGKGNLENEEDAGHRPSDDDTAPIKTEDVIREAMADVSARRRQPADRKLTTLPQKADAAQREWRAAIEETQPTGGMLAWSQREIAMVKAKVKGWTDRRVEFHVFVGWCARNWQLVIRKQLGWMTQKAPPKTPTIGFLISFMEHFREAFADKDLENWMTEDERRKYDRLLMQGRSHGEALLEIAKDDTAIAMRDEIKREKQDIAIKRGMLKRQEARIEVRQRTAPTVDPRSPAAVRARREALGITPLRRLSDAELSAVDLGALTALDPSWEPA